MKKLFKSHEYAMFTSLKQLGGRNKGLKVEIKHSQLWHPLSAFTYIHSYLRIATLLSFFTTNSSSYSHNSNVKGFCAIIVTVRASNSLHPAYNYDASIKYLKQASQTIFF